MIFQSIAMLLINLTFYIFTGIYGLWIIEGSGLSNLIRMGFLRVVFSREKAGKFDALLYFKKN